MITKCDTYTISTNSTSKNLKRTDRTAPKGSNKKQRDNSTVSKGSKKRQLNKATLPAENVNFYASDSEDSQFYTSDEYEEEEKDKKKETTTNHYNARKKRLSDWEKKTRKSL
jgi:hypothetical protein